MQRNNETMYGALIGYFTYQYCDGVQEIGAGAMPNSDLGFEFMRL